MIAIAAGILEGLGLGHNPRAALITRGLAEITRLGVAMGADPLDLRRARRHGRPGAHDHREPEPESRARRGAGAGRDARATTATAHRSVAEGANTSRAGAALGARMGVELPIIQKVCEVLFRGSRRAMRVPELMGRELKAEQWR